MIVYGLGAIALGETAGLGAGSDAAVAGADTGTAGSDAASTGSEAEASAQTAHGLVRAADPSRLDAGAQRDVTAKATETFTQRDGADVYVQEVGGKYNVVIKGSKSVITNLKTINASKLAKLARKYGWVPK